VRQLFFADIDVMASCCRSLLLDSPTPIVYERAVIKPTWIVLLAATAFACSAPAPHTPDPAPVEHSSTEGTEAPAPVDEPATASSESLGSLEAPPDVAAPPPDADVTASGLASRVLQAGTGTAHPSATDRVTVHYTGWTTDGERFDSSRERGEPATFPLNGVIAGWTEGVQLMVEGEHRRFWIPESLAYMGRPGRPAGMLVFDVELIAIE
jgi:peptidylprolyl isomerase